MSQGIKLHASLNKVTTVLDGGWRISFDIPESETLAVMQLSELRNTALTVFVVHDSEVTAMASSELTFSSEFGES